MVDKAIQDGIILAVSLDITNAFNSFPWPTIQKILIEKEVPEYLRRILMSISLIVDCSTATEMIDT